MTIQLTPAQHAILEHATRHTGGRIEWFPDNVKGGARRKVIEALTRHGLVDAERDATVVTAEGFEAMGLSRPAPADAQLEAEVAAAEAAWAPRHRTREDSKQAQVIAMLKRPEGATIAQICAATGWQSHTVRGAFAGALKKKLGLTIVSEKPQGAQRVYRVVA